MSAHDALHEELVEEVLSGTLAPTAPEFVARLAACGACRAEYARLRRLDGEVRAAIGRAREDLRAAAARPPVPGEEALVRDTLVAFLGTGSARAGRAGRTRRLVLAAAAVWVAALAAWFFLRSGDSASEETLLHGGTVACESPIGEVRDYDVFLWRADLPPLARFELRIHVREEGRAGALLLTIPCKEPRWIPTAEERRALPDEIHWEVVLLDLEDVVQGRGWAQASRVP